MVALGYKWNIYSFTPLLTLDSLPRFFGRGVVHGSVLTLFLVVQKMHFLWHWNRSASTTEESMLSAKEEQWSCCMFPAIPLFLYPFLLFIAAALFTSPVFVLLLSKQSRCSGRDASGQAMQFISPFPLLGRPGEPRDLWEGISSLYLFPLKVCLNWIVTPRQECISHCLTSCRLLHVT